LICALGMVASFVMLLSPAASSPNLGNETSGSREPVQVGAAYEDRAACMHDRGQPC
jgi:hypothetical protein